MGGRGRRLETHLQGVYGGQEAGNPPARYLWGGRRLETHLQGVNGGQEAGEGNEGEEVPSVSCSRYYSKEQPATHNNLYRG